MMTFFIIVHVTACIVLIGLVLIQRGRGAGLVESFSGVESMFGTKTSVFLTRTTTVMSVVFFMTCLALAVLSVKQSKSLMRDLPVTKSKWIRLKLRQAKPEAVKPETAQSPALAVTLPAETAKPNAAKVQ